MKTRFTSLREVVEDVADKQHIPIHEIDASNLIEFTQYIPNTAGYFRRLLDLTRTRDIVELVGRTRNTKVAYRLETETGHEFLLYQRHGHSLLVDAPKDHQAVYYYGSEEAYRINDIIEGKKPDAKKHELTPSDLRNLPQKRDLYDRIWEGIDAIYRKTSRR